ncbi:4-hydroxyphenylpyruvate dioxygenase [Ideonella alba]|uniref:4-hydroxyphenylpyruvate dioxygenase n=1 Tax=Ideonella alba TaxID=2824118 RepID=A0A940Y437_9BURK|nr:4-hydroxyphenylpyruvate dioxygenase [Ideonella alba]MBQ0929392.1 4-hydroxyphenylpyruvate dioxygenase [Ideonella alba]
MPTTATPDREALGELPNPMGLLGVEFIEYSTARPQTLGHSLERLGFRPVARHRSREVLLYRQGDMNIVVNAHRPPEAPPLPDRARIAAVALRVRDAASAYRRALERGAWAVPTQVEVMELNIPAIHGVGDSRLYFVDRVGEFSIYDVDFVPIPGVDPRPPALGDMKLFGVVQYIGFERLADWSAFYAELLGFAELPPEAHFGVLTQGRILASPCGTLHWQLIEPAIDAVDVDTEEMLERIAFATPDVLATVAALKARGVEFVESSGGVRTDRAGAVTRPSDTGPSFEFVRDPR